ncbi:MAG: hypothetical protein JSS60_08415 [Verrucomicrobia bacterium]|nr:hypothetical protein [Verrucomicrobiota bacterium]
MNNLGLFVATIFISFSTSLIGLENSQAYRNCRPVVLPEIDVSQFNFSSGSTDPSGVLDNSVLQGYVKVDTRSGWGTSNWGNAIGIARNVSLFEAKSIADSSPDISFFFYVKEERAIIHTINNSCYVFQAGDAVFFTGEPWWNRSLKCSDVYIKQ